MSRQQKREKAVSCPLPQSGVCVSLLTPIFLSFLPRRAKAAAAAAAATAAGGGVSVTTELRALLAAAERGASALQASAPSPFPPLVLGTRANIPRGISLRCGALAPMTQCCPLLNY